MQRNSHHGVSWENWTLTARMAAIVAGVFLCFLCVGPKLRAQVTTGNIVGTVVDSSGAAVPNAQVTLTNVATNATRTATTGATGIFRFPTLPAGTYDVSVDAAGFKKFTTTNIALNASSTRDLGKLTLQVGAVTQTVTVTAEATPIQTSSSSINSTITGAQLNALPLVGRDMFGAVDLIPGVVDTNHNRAVTSASTFAAITINGAGRIGDSSGINFTVDGITSVDTGSNAIAHYDPNMSSIAQLKVLTANYDAQYGRTSGGTIEVITKGGGRQYHGGIIWDHRHEQFNANDWFAKKSGLPRALYRYNVENWSFGGPVPIPKYNTWSKRDKLFFFVSQEFTGQLAVNSIHYINTPNDDIRGTSSADQSCNDGGTMVKCINLNTTFLQDGTPISSVVHAPPGTPYPFFTNGNTGQLAIPMTDVDPYGLALLKFFPEPQFPQGQCSSGQGPYACNYQSQASNKHPRRNTMYRIDWDPSPKLSSFFRYDSDYDDTNPNWYTYVGFPELPVDHNNSGHGYAGSMTYVFSPTLINELTVGYDWNTWSWYPAAGDLQAMAPSNFGNPPLLLPIPTTSGLNTFNYIGPGLTFGSDVTNAVNYMQGFGPVIFNYYNVNPIYEVTDNLSKVKGTHQFKTGIYVDYTGKIQPSNATAYMGQYNFGTDSTNPYDSGAGFVNALLGNYDSFRQDSNRIYFNDKFWNIEPYIQDSWRATKRLTLDYGVRIYYHPPQYDAYKGTYSYFNPSLYDPTKAPRIFVPACTVALQANQDCAGSGGQVRASDPALLNSDYTTSSQQPSAYIGAYVPGTGDTSNGMVLAPAGSPTYGWTFPFAAAPRVGFAWDVFGNGKMAVRGGMGVYYSRFDGNQAWAEAGQVPVSYTYSVSYGSYGHNISQLANTVGVIAPPSINSGLAGLEPWPRTYNGSLNVQRSLGFNSALSVAYVFNLGRTLNLSDNINPVPLGSDFQSSNISPVTGDALTQVGSSQIRTYYPGYQDITTLNFLGFSNYHSLQVQLSHRLTSGLLFNVSYTWGRSTSVTNYDPLVADNNLRNYGLAGSNRNQTLQVTWSYAFPNLSSGIRSSMMGKVANAVIGNWTYSGHYQAQSGAPLQVSLFDVTGHDYAGTVNESSGFRGTVRPDVICNPKSNIPAGFVFNPACFAAPAQGTLGNEGVNPLYGRGINDWDMSLAKFIPIGLGESRGFNLKFSGYNVFNHPQFGSFNTTMVAAGPGTNFSTSSLGAPTALGPHSRVLAFELSFKF